MPYNTDDYDYESEDYESEDDRETPSSSGGGLLEAIAIIGALALISAPAVKGIARRWRIRHPIAEAEPAIDQVLDDSYPASDPPASRYVDIPANRR